MGNATDEYFYWPFFVASCFFAHLTYLLHPLGAVIQGDEIPAAHIESVQVLDCIFGVEDVLIYYKRCPLLVAGLALADLPDGSEPAKHVIHLLRGNLVWQVAHEDNLVDLRGQFNWSSY